jgi:uncharacterized membrane protein
MLRTLVGLILVVLAVSPAEAAFRVCNKSTHAAQVAIGFYDGKNWSSQGWWPIPAGQCNELVSGPLKARYYYLYAVDEHSGGAWDGNRSFCVGEGQFVIPGRVNCVARGYERRTFFQVDTGESIDWTENLAD